MKAIKNGIVLISIGLTLALCVMVYLSSTRTHYEYLDFSANVPVGENYLGIDVSHYQNDINWQDVDSIQHGEDSISFAFLKASEGITLVDSKFRSNVKGIGATDLKFGCYHYFIPSISAQQQANHFIKTIADVPFNLKPVLDVEVLDGLSSSELQDSISVFKKIVETAFETDIIIYTYLNFYNDNLKEVLAKDQLIWIANYNNDYDFYNAEYAQIWQFSDNGTVDGIGGEVDLNIAKKGSWKVIQME